jgi:hypothetical protein
MSWEVGGVVLGGAVLQQDPVIWSWSRNPKGTIILTAAWMSATASYDKYQHHVAMGAEPGPLMAVPHILSNSWHGTADQHCELCGMCTC